MAELADALDSGSSESNFMQVQVLFPAPDQYNPNQIFQIGNGFGFFLIFQSQRYNPLDLASMVSMQEAEIPRNPCEIMIQQSSYRDILLYLSYIKNNKRLFRTATENAAVLGMDKSYDRMFRHVFTPIPLRMLQV